MGKLAPSVEKPVPRLRLGFIVALLLAISGGLVALLIRSRTPTHLNVSETNSQWDELRPHCTPLEVEVALRERNIDPKLRVGCLAIAGKIDAARQSLSELPADERAITVDALFAIAHPIADAGDDRSAGPIMKLVVELSPNNYMAVFHAGMADYALGNDGDARAMLLRFLDMYTQQDIWRERAQHALAGIDAHQPLAEREAHFAE